MINKKASKMHVIKSIQRIYSVTGYRYSPALTELKTTNSQQAIEFFLNEKCDDDDIVISSYDIVEASFGDELAISEYKIYAMPATSREIALNTSDDDPTLSVCLDRNFYCRTNVRSSQDDPYTGEPLTPIEIRDCELSEIIKLIHTGDTHRGEILREDE